MPAQLPRAAAAAATLGLLLAFPLNADAQRLRIAVLPFEGPQATEAQREIERALAPLAELVEAGAVAAALRKSGAKSDEAVAALALDLEVQFVVSGRLRQERRLVLAVTLRDANGSALRSLESPMPGRKLDPATLQRAGEQLSATVVALRLALQGPESPRPDSSEPEPPPPPPPPPPPALREPYLDGSLGLLLTGRRFGFGKRSPLDGLATCQPGATSCPGYRGAIAAGLRVDLTLYPLRFFSPGRGGWRFLVGLGVGATYDFVGWPASVDSMAAPGACGGATTCRFATREQRLTAGLRYRFRIVPSPGSPLLTASLQVGFHPFSIDPPADGMTIVPSVTYVYPELAAGIIVPIAGRASIGATISGYPAVAGGAIQSAAEYGPGGGVGVRGNLAAEVRVWRDLTVRLGGFYEVLWLSFNGSGPPRKTTDGDSSDAYWGLVLGVGYAY